MTDYSEFDEAIAAADAEAAALFDPMEQVVAQFVAATKDWATATYKSWVQRQVQDKPERVTSLGMDGLRQMKAELSELVAELPRIVEKTVEQNAFWSHRPDAPRPVFTHSGDPHEYTRAREPLNEAIRDLLAPLGSLLIKYRFASSQQGTDWQPLGGDRVRYRYGLTHSREMAEALQRYGQLNLQHAGAVQKRADAERKKLAAQAADLWESA